MKNITQSLKVIALSLILSFGISFIYAWTGPTAIPPAGNVDAPINTSANKQTKAGTLYVNEALGVGGIFSGFSGASFSGAVIMEEGSQIQLKDFASTTVGFIQGVNNQIQFQNSGGVAKMTIDTSSGGALVMKSGGQLQLNNSTDTAVGFIQGVNNQIQFQNSGGSPSMTIDTSSGNVGIGNTTPTATLEVAGTVNAGNIKSSAGGFTFPDGSTQLLASYLMTDTYIGNGIDNREILVGFSPDDVEIGTVQSFASSPYSTVHRNRNMQSGYSQFIDSADWTANGIKSFTLNGFTIGTIANVNEAGRSYWFKAFKGGRAPGANPTISSFSANKNLVGTNFHNRGFLDQPVTLTWSSAGASSCTASNGARSGWTDNVNKTLSGSQIVYPETADYGGANEAQTYTLTCYNQDKLVSATASLTINVRAWAGTTTDGNYNESCNTWLTRVNQKGINNSAPWANFGSDDSGMGKCLYGTQYQEVINSRSTWLGAYLLGDGSWVYVEFGDPADSSPKLFPVAEHYANTGSVSQYLGTKTRR